jgi:hypothetical protein
MFISKNSVTLVNFKCGSGYSYVLATYHQDDIYMSKVTLSTNSSVTELRSEKIGPFGDFHGSILFEYIAVNRSNHMICPYLSRDS